MIIQYLIQYAQCASLEENDTVVTLNASSRLSFPFLKLTVRTPAT